MFLTASSLTPTKYTYFLFGFTFHPLLTFGFWTNIPVVIVEYGVGLSLTK